MLWQGHVVHAWLNAKLEAKTQGALVLFRRVGLMLQRSSLSEYVLLLCSELLRGQSAALSVL